MAVTESFLVNTNSFDSIIEALIERDEIPEKITDELFASMGFDNPSDLLVIHILKELEIITADRKPTELYAKLVNPDTTNEAIATGIIHAYTDLFERNPELHQLQKDDIYEALNSYFEGRKTELIIKYMTNTFQKLVTYAGINNVQKAVDEYFGHTDESSPADEITAAKEQVLEETTDIDTNPDPDAVPAPNEDVTSDDEDSDFDDIFFGEESKEEPREVFEEPESSEEPETPDKNKNESINFDELFRIFQEEEGSGNGNGSLNSGNTNGSLNKESEEEQEELLTNGRASDTSEEVFSDDDAELAEAETDEEPVPSINRESLEKELQEINLASTNGSGKNGAEVKDKSPSAEFENVPTNEKVKKALIKKAELLYKLERFEDALPAYNEIISFFGDSETDHFKEAVASAVIRRVVVLKKLNRKEELLPALDEVINRFENSKITEYYEQASLAMLQKAQLLEDASHDVLLPLFNAIIDRLRNSTNPNIKTKVDEIFFKRVNILAETGSEHEQLDAVDELIDRFKDSQTHTGQLEQAMYKKAEILENLNQNEEALKAYSQFLDKFGKTKTTERV